MCVLVLSVDAGSSGLFPCRELFAPQLNRGITDILCNLKKQYFRRHSRILFYNMHCLFVTASLCVC